MFTNLRKKYILIITLSLVGVITATPSFANSQEISSSHNGFETLTSDLTPSGGKSIFSNPKVRRDIACDTSGLCYSREEGITNIE
ncbi:MAG TPA: hypothetical protein DEF27_00350 [Oscillatoriales bacterium UBA8482]|nr:MAG: hypothetical protein AUK43_20415 [Oscillatoriales cyanobacterium CG2_30_40_61]HBW56315.1 hypothetical protein [Oscillatoriales bacterium UBA8482]